MPCENKSVYFALGEHVTCMHEILKLQSKLQSLLELTFRRNEFARKKRRFDLAREPNVAILRAQKGGFCISSHFRPALKFYDL